jgi:predicted enzyme related to lactoylglutathione lyase
MAGVIPRGRFVWYDLMTSDLDAAVDFYTRLAGWGTAPWEGEGDPYTMWANDGVPLGGVMPLPEEAKAANARPYWMAYVSVPDAKAIVAQTEELGGSVVVPATAIPNVGSFAILHDPQGGAFTAFTPLEAASGIDESPKVGDFSWHELATTDAEAAFDFYHQIFGWEQTEDMDMGAMGTYQMYGHGGSSLGGIFRKPDEVDGPPAWLYYIRVRDANEAALTIQMLGGQVMSGPMEVPGGDLVAHCLDPQGGTFAIHQVAEEE